MLRLRGTRMQLYLQCWHLKATWPTPHYWTGHLTVCNACFLVVEMHQPLLGPASPWSSLLRSSKAVSCRISSTLGLQWVYRSHHPLHMPVITQVWTEGNDSIWNFNRPPRQAWWYTLIIPELGRQRKEDWKFKASLGYIVMPCYKQTKTQKSISPNQWLPGFHSSKSPLWEYQNSQ